MYGPLHVAFCILIIVLYCACMHAFLMQESFSSVTSWINDISSYAGQNIVRMLIENKSDLKKTNRRKIPRGAGEVSLLSVAFAYRGDQGCMVVARGE